jgi:hypothetical protein
MVWQHLYECNVLQSFSKSNGGLHLNIQEACGWRRIQYNPTPDPAGLEQGTGPGFKGPYAIVSLPDQKKILVLVEILHKLAYDLAPVSMD